MGFQVSPGVEVKEIDLTNVIPAVSTSIGGYSGYFRWGPVNEIRLVSSEKELAGKFGTPDTAHTQSFLTAASFLKYGNALKVVRAGDGGTSANPAGTLANASAGTFEILIGGIEGVTIQVEPSEFTDVTGAESLTLVETGTGINGNGPEGAGATIAPRYDVATPTVAQGYSLSAAATVNISGAQSGDPLASHTITNGAYDVTIQGQTVNITVADNGEVVTVDSIGAADTARTSATYTIGSADYSVLASGGGASSGTGAEFTVVDDGTTVVVTVTNAGTGYAVDDQFTIADAQLGGNGAANLTFDVASVGQSAAVTNGETVKYVSSNATTAFTLDDGGTAVSGLSIDTASFVAVTITSSADAAGGGDVIDNQVLTVYTTSGDTTSPSFTVTVTDSSGTPSYALAAGVANIADFDTLSAANKSGLQAFEADGVTPINGLFFDATYDIASIASLTDGTGYVVSATTVAIDGVSLEIGNFFLDEQENEFDSDRSGNILIENEDAFEAITPTSGSILPGLLFARYPGALGNSLGAYILDQASYAAAPAAVKAEFDAAPTGTEVHVFVFDEDGDITGTAGTELEKWSYLDSTAGAKLADGSNNYYKDVVNEQSDWMYVGRETIGKSTPYSFVGGADVANAGVAGANDIQTGLEEFADSELVDVNLLFAQVDTTGGVIAQKLQTIATNRKDCVAFVSNPISVTTSGSTEASDVITAIQSNGVSRTIDGSYAVFDSTALYVYNKYADNYVYIPASGHMAGLCAKTDDLAEPWFSPAGFNRGGLLGVTKLAYNPKKADRDELYKAGINPIVSFPGEGIVLFGDKTAQAKPSAFDRINVRRLFIVLEKAIATAAKFQLFELNDSFTQAMFRNMTIPFLRGVKGRRGITDFLVVCDETNNTGDVVDTNRFVADIYIKPARSINFITLNFIATRTGVDFSEIVGK